MDRVGEHDATPQGVATSPVRGDDESRFPIDVPGYQGTLEDLLRRAQRGDIDLTQVSVSAITDSFRIRLEGAPARPEMRDVADFLTLVARLVSLKATAVLPDQPLGEDWSRKRTQAVRRVAAWLNTAFSRRPQRRSWPTPQTLGHAASWASSRPRSSRSSACVFRRSVWPRHSERCSSAWPRPSHSLSEPSRSRWRRRSAQLRAQLAEGACLFEDLFTGCASRLEAVACFLALLELLRLGEATVDQRGAVGPITVTGRG